MAIMRNILILSFALIAITIAQPVDYDELAGPKEIKDSPASNTRDDGKIYDSGIFTKYPDDKRELNYQPPDKATHAPSHKFDKREVDANKNNDVDDVLDVNKNLFASLFEFTRPQRKADSNEVAQTVHLPGLVSAVESTLLNSAKDINKVNLNSVKSTTPTTTANPNEAGLGVDKRIERAIEIPSNAKTEDADELDKDVKLDVDVAKPRYVQNLSLLAPIAFSTPKVQKDESVSTSTIPTVTSASPPVHHTNITIVHSTNTTHVIPSDGAVHVQHQHIQQSIFHSNLAILPTIPSQLVNIPSTSPVSVEKVKDSEDNDCDEEDHDDDDHEDDDDDDDDDRENSSEEKKKHKKKCVNKTSSSSSKDAEDSAAIKEELKLLKKAQKLKEKIAEVEADPVILSQGI